MNTHVLLIASPDRKGLIHTITGVLLDHGVNIISNSEYVEKETDSFFMRTEFSGVVDKEFITNKLQKILPEKAFIQLVENRKKDLVLLATKEIHCLGDLLLRNYSGELNGNIRAVISNYNNLYDLVTKFGVKFHFISQENISREEHEKEILQVLGMYDPEYLVLAKYMKILSPKVTALYHNRILNIHHSFLPAFVGARPYEQAHKRGVKIIGATAHFVNENLDEGPIIAQSVIPVDHSQSAAEMAQAGRDVEKMVLARALKLVLEERVFVSGNKTIIFD
jgi:formyltetrahydrofolate deformylase